MIVYLAVNKDGTERVFVQHPRRDASSIIKHNIPFERWNQLTSKEGEFWSVPYVMDGMATLKSGSIEDIIGRKLIWEDEPVRVDRVDIENFLK